jgi:photosynthetic reaction center cytochrome c subunit
MRVDRTKTWLVLSGLILCVVLALAGVRAQSPAQSPAPNAPAIPLAEQQYKNIQTLKGIPADQMIPAMQFISASLGVDCEYCHVRGAMEKDDKKPKLTAREMISMMMAINKENFKGHREVTCYSCHRGAADPVGTPMVANEDSKPESREEKKPNEEKPALPSAEQILDKYLAAVGGAEALQKITSRTEKGTLTMVGDKRLLVDVYAKAPDKRVSIMHLPEGDSVTGFDGRSGWQSINSHPPRVRLSTAAETAAARIDADFYFPLHLRELFTEFAVTPGEPVAGQKTYLVTGGTTGQPPLKLYFDQQSGLLLRLVRYLESPLGRLPTQVDYADYRQADGVKIPFRWTLSRPGNRFTIQVDQLEQNVPVDDAKFNPPPTQKNAEKPAAQ